MVTISGDYSASNRFTILNKPNLPKINDEEFLDLAEWMRTIIIQYLDLSEYSNLDQIKQAVNNKVRETGKPFSHEFKNLAAELIFKLLKNTATLQDFENLADIYEKETNSTEYINWGLRN